MDSMTEPNEETPKKKRRGFAAMSADKQKEIASKGGKAHARDHMAAIGAKGGKAKKKRP